MIILPQISIWIIYQKFQRIIYNGQCRSKYKTNIFFFEEMLLNPYCILKSTMFIICPIMLIRMFFIFVFVFVFFRFLTRFRIMIRKRVKLGTIERTCQNLQLTVNFFQPAQGVRSGKENARRAAQKLWCHKMSAAASCDVTAAKRFINSPGTVVLLP